MDNKALSEIYHSCWNGQFKQMTEQIDNYGFYDFFVRDYKDYLKESFQDNYQAIFNNFYDVVKAYTAINK